VGEAELVAAAVRAAAAAGHAVGHAGAAVADAHAGALARLEVAEAARVEDVRLLRRGEVRVQVGDEVGVLRHRQRRGAEEEGEEHGEWRWGEVVGWTLATTFLTTLLTALAS
jgi:hypothetical protein